MSLLKKIAVHFHGESPHVRDVIAVYLIAAGMGIAYIWASPNKEMTDWLMALLAADLAGGIVSNATLSTRTYFRKQGSSARNVFWVLHGVIYPLIIVGVLGVMKPVGVLMLVACATKICLHAVATQDDN